MNEQSFSKTKPEVIYVEVDYPQISYNEATDTLWMGNGLPTPVKRDITKGIFTIFFDSDGIVPTAVTLSGALRLLAPHLNGDIPCTEEDSSRAWHEGLEQQFLEISYEDESDTLWLGNGKPGSTGHDICYGVFIAFFDSTDRTPIGVMMDSAAELLRSHLPLEEGRGGQHSPVSHVISSSRIGWRQMAR